MYSKFNKIPLLLSSLLLLLFGGLFQATVQQESETSFVCPEEFGYFPHPSDCSQYYVCVFGGALLESCTGGLMYSHELQTCDWPRNVKTPCNVSIATQPNNNNHLVQHNLQPTTQIRQRVRGGASSTTPSSYAYKPIKIENYEEINSAISRNSQNNDEFTNGRNQRSYEQAQPSYKFSNSEKDVPLARSVGGNGYNNNGKKQYSQQYSQPPPQQEDPYSNLRYAAAVPANNSASYVYAKEQEPQDDSSYYVYDDNSSANYDDVDYKAYGGGNQYVQQQVTTTTTTTTRRPKTTLAPAQQKQRTRTQSSSSSSRRPTLKPKSQIVKDAAPVRDVYLDAPSRPAPVYESPTVNTPASKCRRDTCVLPDCNCGGKEIPGNLRPEETPQIVLLTFDDSVNDLNKNLYRDLFEKGRKNPNGCPISATFYVSHEWTDYSQVQNLAADGHEIASHSVSHSFGEAFSQKKWTTEINGQREILAAYGGVKLSEVRGMRAPFLAIGGNNMFKMLHDANFTYDSSMPVYENRPPSWPYTLDYKIFHDCMIPPCPTKSYPGVWEVPMVMWQDLKGGRCSMGDACSNPPTAEGVYQMLAKNFERHYTTNRAPFGLYYHAAWFTQPHHKEGFEAFLDTLVQMDDVWLVTNWQAIQWVRSPTPTSRINNFQPFNTCHATNQDRPGRCNHPRVCNLWHKSGVRYMKTCQTCPQQYPWTGNTGVPYTI